MTSIKYLEAHDYYKHYLVDGMASPRLHRSFINLLNLWNRMVFPQAIFEIVPDSQTPSTDGAFGAENFDSRVNPDVADVLRQLTLSDGRMDHSFGNLEYDDDNIYTTNNANPAESESDQLLTEADISMSSAHATSESAMITLPPNDVIAIPPTPVAELSDPPATKKATRTCSSARNTAQAQATTNSMTPANSEV